MKQLECGLCDNPYPYMCSECANEDQGPAASRQHVATASMGKEYLNQLNGSINKEGKAKVKLINIASGEDAEIHFS